MDLKKTGVYPYAQHPNTDIWCFAWAFDDEEPTIWYPGMTWPGYFDGIGVPQVFLEHIANGGELRAWNAAFERIIWKHILTPRYGFPEPKLEQWVCSAAEAAAMALPRALDYCAQVTGVTQQKDEQGYRLMLQMTRPRKINDDGTIVWWDLPEKVARLHDYCKQDVRTERAITKVLRRLVPAERQQYLLTERMNDRGLTLDVDLVLAAKDVADEGVRRANEALATVTAGAVTEVTKVGQLKAWLESEGHPAESLSKAGVRELLEAELPPDVRQVLELRAEAGRSSLAKLDSMLECVCTDGVIRGMLMYHGASTGRWTGRLAQLHNLARPEIDNVEDFIDLVLARNYEALALFHNPIDVIVSLLRSMLTASEGHELLAADYSAIEARVLNWLAGQDDILELFAKGEDVYKYNAARLYGIPLDQVQKFPHRQTGKFQELGCGYGMGAKKAVSAGKSVYGLELTEEQAKAIVDNYRKTHERVVSLWYKAEACAIQAVEKPGSVVPFGGRWNGDEHDTAGTLRFMQAGAYLYLQLPSGRPLVYAAPKIVERETPWGEKRAAVEVSAVNSVTRKWSRQSMYGGLWVENIVQATARDIMAEGKMRLEAAGYPVLLSVHDEVISEKPVGEGDLKEFETLLATPPAWAAGCPISTEGWRGFRYRK